MKPKLLKISVSPEHSFSCRFDSVPFFYSEWHFHPEIELVYIQQGTGTQFIGNNIAHFANDDLILVGSNLPHLWKCDEIYFEKNTDTKAQSLVIHFLPNVFGEYFLQMPENRLLADLQNKAKVGLSIKGNTKQLVVEKMKLLLVAKGAERVILLLDILNTIALSNETVAIAKNNIPHNFSEKEGERMNNIFQYLINNFTKEISLEAIASKANLSPNAFCRFFKSRTKKNFSTFLIEMRINYACKLLAESEKSVGNICFESGFNNAAHFNRYFKQITNATPLEYRRRQLEKSF